MQRVITAMFDDYDAAAEAVGRLKAAGIPESDISLVGGNERMRSTDPSVTSATDDTSNAGAGATTGAIIGGGAGLLAGVGLLAIPGLGPVVAAGWLASTLVGGVAGAAAGGIIGALTDWGMSEEDAHTYAEGIRRGGTMVSARVDESMMSTAVDILDVEGTVDMTERSRAWRSEGWQPPITTPAPGSETRTPPPRMAEGTSVPVAGETGTRRVHVSTLSEPSRPSDVEVDDTRGMGTGRASGTPGRRA